MEIGEYKCSTAIGLMQAGESLSEYTRRAHYELDRVEAVLERHRRWHTHLDERTAECPICTISYLARSYLRVLEQYGAVASEHQSDSRDVVDVEPSA